MPDKKNLKKQVDAEVEEATEEAKTGNEQTIDQDADTLKEASTGENVQEDPDR